jgi:hypothetical protein
MTKYYIYHIKGKKIGCTKNPSNRIKQQNAIEWEILETHTDIDVASQREIELQKQYGYPTDTSTYKQSVQNDAGKQNIAGRASASKQWQENRDREMQKSYKGGKVNAELNGKPVIMCDKNGNDIKEFKNRKEAADFVNGFKSTLVGTIDKPFRTYKGYMWKSKS